MRKWTKIFETMLDIKYEGMKGTTNKGRAWCPLCGNHLFESVKSYDNGFHYYCNSCAQEFKIVLLESE